jgi:hypothetical protein
MSESSPDSSFDNAIVDTRRESRVSFRGQTDEYSNPSPVVPVTFNPSHFYSIYSYTRPLLDAIQAQAPRGHNIYAHGPVTLTYHQSDRNRALITQAREDGSNVSLGEIDNLNDHSTLVENIAYHLLQAGREQMTGGNGENPLPDHRGSTSLPQRGNLNFTELTEDSSSEEIIQVSHRRHRHGGHSQPRSERGSEEIIQVSHRRHRHGGHSQPSSGNPPATFPQPQPMPPYGFPQPQFAFQQPSAQLGPSYFQSQPASREQSSWHGDPNAPSSRHMPANQRYSHWASPLVNPMSPEEFPHRTTSGLSRLGSFLRHPQQAWRSMRRNSTAGDSLADPSGSQSRPATPQLHPLPQRRSYDQHSPNDHEPTERYYRPQQSSAGPSNPRHLNLQQVNCKGGR